MLPKKEVDRLERLCYEMNEWAISKQLSFGEMVLVFETGKATLLGKDGGTKDAKNKQI